MSTSFSSTLRTLQNDSQNFSLGWVALISLLLLGWLSWFLFAPLSHSVEGKIVSVDGDGVVHAQFPNEMVNLLHIGQKSTVLLNADGQIQPIRIPATLSDILPPTGATSAKVEFYVDLDAPTASAFDRESTGSVSVVIEQISPATQIWRATGQLIDTPPAQVQ